MGEPPTPADAPVVLISTDRPGTATVTLNRPSRHNAWTVPMQREYFAALDRLSNDENVRAIVVRGSGRTFCPGADTAALEVYGSTGTTNPEMKEIEHSEWFAATVPKPVITAIEGACAGVGLAQALLCDLRVAAPDARFSTAFTRRGLPPMHAMAPLLTRTVGSARATDLLLTARTVNGDEAQQLGLVHEVTDAPISRALDIAEELSTWCGPTAMWEAKRELVASWLPLIEGSVHRVDGRLDTVLSSAEFLEGINSWVQRRAPRFPPLVHPPKETRS